MFTITELPEFTTTGTVGGFVILKLFCPVVISSWLMLQLVAPSFAISTDDSANDPEATLLKFTCCGEIDKEQGSPMIAFIGKYCVLWPRLLDST